MTCSIFSKTGKVLRQTLLVSIAVVGTAITAAQTTDSLESVLKKPGLPINEQVAIHKELASRYLLDNATRTLLLSKRGLAMAKEAGDQTSEASFYYFLGTAFYRNTENDSALSYLDRALTLSRQIASGQIEAKVEETYGRLYRAQGQYTEALDHFLKAVKIHEIRNDEEGLSTAFAGIGAVYQVMKNYDIALVYFEKAEKLAIKHNSKEGLFRIYISLANVYTRLGADSSKCFQYARKALELSSDLGSAYFENDALQTMAHVYFLHDDYAGALPFAERAVHNAEELGSPRQIAYSLIILSNVHYHLKQYHKSVAAALQAYDKDSSSADLNMNIYSNLSKAYAQLGDIGLMEQYMQSYHEVIAAHSNDAYQRSLSEMEVKYETEKKALKIGNLEKQRQLYIWLGIAGAGLLLVALAFALARYRLAVRTRRLAEEKAQRLEQEKQLVAVQAALDGEAAERTRLAKDLHDGLGSMLSLVKFNLPQVKGSAVLEAVDVSRFQTAIGMLDDSIRELRRVAHHMMPESLLRHGLKASLSDFCDAIPNANFHYFGNESRLPEQLEVMVYRCVHELVNNVLKHANANHINVQLIHEENRVSFTVQDDGSGFKQEGIVEGMGLNNVRQRVMAFGGEMNIYSTPQGTEIIVELVV